MNGLWTIIKKELSDHFSSYRFVILFALIAMVSLITVYLVGLNIRSELEGAVKPKFVFLMLFTASGSFFSLVQFVAFFGPLVGLMLGFDTINRERNEGTLSKLIAQPIYRDVVINAKFLAGLVLIAIMLLSILMVITGLGIIFLGIVPGLEEIGRVAVYFLISVVYVAFWLAIAIFFSIIFRSTATSALAALAVWIFFSFFIPIGLNALGSTLSKDVSQAPSAKVFEQVLARAKTVKRMSLASPMELYSDATATIIDPMRRTVNPFIMMGPMERLSISQFEGPLPMAQSILIVTPYILALVALSIVCFGFCYIIFMRQEIRSI